VRAGHLQHESTPVGVWTSLNRVLLTLIVVTTLGVIVFRFLPETQRRQEGGARIAQLSEQVEKLKQKVQRAKREAELLLRDPEYIALLGRDRLDLLAEGEKVYRLVPDAPLPPVAPAKSGARPTR